MFSMLVILALCCFCCSHGLQQREIAMFNNGVGVDSATNASFYLITASGLPNHATQKVNPNDATHQNHEFWIPKSPAAALKSTCLPMASIGISKNGVSLFNPLTVEGYNAVEGPHKETFDSCNGHPTSFGTYHYHQLPKCLYNGTADEFIGVAFDGYPIYGPNATDLGRSVNNSDLDSCHGRTSMINGVPAYRYWITTQFPYILGCYKGTVTSQAGVTVDTKYPCPANATACNCPMRSKPNSAFNVGYSCWMMSFFLVVAVYAGFKE